MSQRVVVKDGAKWGEWHLEADKLMLVLRSGKRHYEVGLADITDSARMLDWIFQLRLKTWATNDIVGDLVSAFQDLLQPQTTICGGGFGRTIDAKAHLENMIVKR